MRGIGRHERKRFYAFVDASIAAIPDNSHSRETLLLDCVDADAFELGTQALDNEEALSLIRVMSTRRRFFEDYGLEEVFEGDWLEIISGKDPGAPRAWQMPALSAYESEGGTNIRHIAKLPPPGDGGPAAMIAARLEKECTLGDAKVFGDERAQTEVLLRAARGSRVEIRAVDVGQASCNLFLIDGKPVGYFDAGAPLYRNQKSFHGRLCHAPPPEGFVILSHWDFDHFDLGRRRPELQKLLWLAPDQPVGPNTLKFQKALGSNLSFLSAPLVTSQIVLRPGLSTKAKDRNGSGFSMRIEVENEIVVLTGDCSYDLIDPAQLIGATAVTMPHHAGYSEAPVPRAQGTAIAIASYGLPNCYRHPCERYIEEHDAAGWRVVRTAAYNGFSRGSRTIYA